jgi:hypothetical protein
MLVLLWGLLADDPLAAVLDQLLVARIPVRFVDQREVLETRVRLRGGGERIRASVRIFDEEFSLDDVTAAYLRPYASRELPHVAASGPQSEACHHADAVDGAMATWCELTTALLVNPFEPMAANNSKPYQLEQIRKLGWRVPSTLITTDPAAARDFWERHGSAVYKSISAVRSKVSRLQAEHLDRFASISSCPTQFQEYIAGVDYRVHVVGQDVFACEISSEADDYRYAQAPYAVHACQLPADVEDCCRSLASCLRLPLAGIDLRRTPDGEWVCFEVNPSPGFTCFGAEMAQRIAQALVGLLTQEAQQPLPVAVVEPAAMLTGETVTV